MIAKEAIETLKANYPDACYGELREAVDKAIESLRAQDGTDTNVGSNGDAIYRQDAIDVIMGQPPELHYPSWYAEQIKSLPSAQPEPCGDAVSRQTLQKELALYPIDDITSEDEAGYNRAINDVQKMVLHLPSAQPEKAQLSGENATFDCISRQTVIDAIDDIESEVADGDGFQYAKWREYFCDLPSAQPVVKDTNVPNNDDIISRHAVIDRAVTIPMFGRDVKMVAVSEIKNLPSAQPEHTCVNCGRTVNNGGWYADGRTKCPIEEHYALPKDGYCHLWEKRNVTDDDYPERRTDE